MVLSEILEIKEINFSVISVFCTQLRNAFTVKVKLVFSVFPVGR